MAGKKNNSKQQQARKKKMWLVSKNRLSLYNLTVA
jgi:hypothetical protein